MFSTIKKSQNITNMIVDLYLPNRFPPTLIPKPKHTLESLAVDVDELLKRDMAKSRPIPENTWYHWYDWLVNHFPESMKKSERRTKRKVMRLYESKIDNNTPMDCKLKEIPDDFESRYNEYKSEKDKKSSTKECLEKIRPHLLYMIDSIKKSGEWEIHPTMKSKNM